MRLPWTTRREYRRMLLAQIELTNAWCGEALTRRGLMEKPSVVSPDPLRNWITPEAYDALVTSIARKPPN